MPSSVFVKSLPKSVAYMAADLLMWGAVTIAMSVLVNSSIWLKLPFVLKAVATALYWNVAGFLMWCVFVVGHDCGHTTFSNYKLLNDIVGHFTHGSLLVPFYSWQLSHRRHHMFHNHVDKDYSYIWYTEERMNSPAEVAAKKMHDFPILLGLYPFIAWQLYLLGINDGSHLFPVSPGRLWHDSNRAEKVKCLISTAVVAASAVAIAALNSFSWRNILFFYVGPHTVFSWWLFCVTYLQHHGPATVAYSDKTWSYVRAAFETVDRTFGRGVDALHHHITDGHVAHHLFFTQIPHYSLPAATAALRGYLQEHGISDMYRHEDTRDFPVRLHRYMMTAGFRTVMASEPIGLAETEAPSTAMTPIA